MKAADYIKQRSSQWSLLEKICDEIEKSPKKVASRRLSEFGTLYRAACADLALADAYQLPQTTVRYLHNLVARAHNQLYRSRKFDFKSWRHQFFHVIPQSVFQDVYVRFAFVLFWGMFFLGMYLASPQSPVSTFSNKVLTEEFIMCLEKMYTEAPGGSTLAERSEKFGFYVMHNTGIGLRCFALGLIWGVGGLFGIVFNALFLGSVFGYMTGSDNAAHFFEFVTAHGPFELTAIVLSGAAGMRLGFALLVTNGLKRSESLQRTAYESMPIMGLAMLLFFLAAIIEGFISPSSLPYEIKALVGTGSLLSLIFYFLFLGRTQEDKVLRTADLKQGFKLQKSSNRGTVTNAI